MVFQSRLLFYFSASTCTSVCEKGKEKSNKFIVCYWTNRRLYKVETSDKGFLDYRLWRKSLRTHKVNIKYKSAIKLLKYLHKTTSISEKITKKITFRIKTHKYTPRIFPISYLYPSFLLFFCEWEMRENTY